MQPNLSTELLAEILRGESDVIYAPSTLKTNTKHVAFSVPGSGHTVHFLQTNAIGEAFIMFATTDSTPNTNHFRALSEWVNSCQSAGILVTRTAVLHQQAPGSFRITHATTDVASLLQLAITRPENQRERFVLAVA
jgi:hypothetical protein